MLMRQQELHQPIQLGQLGRDRIHAAVQPSHGITTRGLTWRVNSSGLLSDSEVLSDGEPLSDSELLSGSGLPSGSGLLLVMTNSGAY